MSPYEIKLRVSRVLAGFNCGINIWAQFGSESFPGILFMIGLYLMGFIAGRWLRQNMYLYDRLWNVATLVALITVFLPAPAWEWLFRFDGCLWVMLLIATFPPSSGKRRRKLLDSLPKIPRRWAGGIPVHS
ncbi:hypothetical protein CBQ26_13565 [Deinococcus indicus]|uniref:Uncharacterized protein n=1 Tax=Deinococcus indicus TaxID=223556 RepID=A0A246BIJ6_9DEIO|nr:hypothetical protein [Deinococcus indicus]OWL95075.1 hypothetical protein CBQ26_13565 [Deinococcus indicus]